MKNRTALITGAGQGMGLAIARALGALGARIAINDLNQESAEKSTLALRANGVDALSAPADITDKPAVGRMVAQTLEHFGTLHILVNNAGLLHPTKVADIPEKEWDRVLAVNLKGTFLCSQAALPAMKAAGWGRIVNISSTAGKSVSTVGGAHYTSAKAGVLGFTRHLAKEVAAGNITVNAVCPGLIDTEMVRATIDDERTEAYARSFPIPRLGHPQEVAELVAFLASEKAAYITGASFDINGGDLMI